MTSFSLLSNDQSIDSLSYSIFYYSGILANRNNFASNSRNIIQIVFSLGAGSEKVQQKGQKADTSQQELVQRLLNTIVHDTDLSGMRVHVYACACSLLISTCEYMHVPSCASPRHWAAVK